MKEADDAWHEVSSRVQPALGAYEPTVVSDLPEVAQRYFNHAIAPGTLLRTAAQIEMAGTFLLGDKSGYQTYSMNARQILRPPTEFVWIPQMKSGFINISGSDALVAGSAWTRFWLFGLFPVAEARSSPDLVRSAVFRSAMEAVWVPASLLPQQGVKWEQIGPDTARVHIKSVSPALDLEITLGPTGSITEIVGQRWSNANPEKIFRYQPFGGTVQEEGTFDGYTIPSVMSVGNNYGTDDYLPFFQAKLTRVKYW
jgi:hypothetical protein